MVCMKNEKEKKRKRVVDVLPVDITSFFHSVDYVVTIYNG